MPKPSAQSPKSSFDPETVLTSSGTPLRFYRADCLEVLGQLPPGSVDLVVTSPPYNLGIRYKTFDDSMPRAAYLEWTSAWIGAIAGVLAPEGSFFLNVGAKPKDPWLPFDVAQIARRHLVLQNTLHWVKSIAIERDAAGLAAGLDRDLAVGHYKPINSDRFVNDCQEFIFHFSPAGTTPLERRAIGVPYQDKTNIARWQAAGGGLRCRGNTWFIPYETIQSRDRERPHPATFPAKLPELCLRLHGLSRVRLALDPFLGLGSSAVACARLGVPFIGVELDEDYLKEALTRTRAAIDGASPTPPLRGTRRRADHNGALPFDDEPRPRGRRGKL